MAYANGYAPENRMISLGSGYDKYGPWKWLLPPGTAKRWRWVVAKAKEKYGIELRISAGWNAYRPYRIQVVYRRDLGIWAAVPGSSSHGGMFWWKGRYIPFFAIDVNNWRSLGSTHQQAWSRFVALCRAAGLATNFVTPQELWHIGDPDPWVIPAGLDPQPLPKPEKKQIGDDENMYFAVTRSKTLTEFFWSTLLDVKKITHAEAVAINRAYGMTGDNTMFNRISATDADRILNVVRYMRSRNYENIAKAVDKQVADDFAALNADLDAIKADLAPQVAAEAAQPVDPHEETNA